MNFKSYIFLPLFALLLGMSSNSLTAQCLDWVAPTDSTGWNDFNTIFGGAPCDDGTGCPFNEITDFEVFASEAYGVADFIAGGSYTFSMCNGSAGAWVPEFTIIAPSGTVEAFGAGDGDGCSISWTAAEDGTYLIVINEAGECGGGPNVGTANGFPALTCTAGADCGPVVTDCSIGEMITTGSVAACGDDGTFTVTVIDDIVPTDGENAWLFSDELGGTGGLAGGFSIINADSTETWNSDLNGILSANALPPLSGEWVIRAAIRDAADVVCDTSTDSLVVNFAPAVVVESVVNNMDGSATVNAAEGTAPYTYLWSDPMAQTTQTAVDLPEGTYTVTVTDAVGCTAEGLVNLIDGSMACTDWVAPTDSSGWVDFNTIFGGAPCDDGSGCPFNEITDFEVFAAEAYSVVDFIAGGEYAFSMCNGDGAGTWVPEFTIIAPSGAIDAFGAGDGDSCTISWTATESGTYLIVINEAGECGGGPNVGTGNGFPALTCLANAMCPVIPDVCNVGDLLTTGTVSACGADGTFTVTVTNDTLPPGGTYVWQFSDELGGTGGLAGGFSIINADSTETWNSDINGILSANNLPVLDGPWVITGAIRDSNEVVCSTTEETLTVFFGPAVELTVDDNGDATATANASGGTEPFTYAWSDDNAQTTATAVSLPSGTYFVTVTDAIGCTATDSVNVVDVSVDDIASLEKLTVSPNPAKGNFFVSVQLAGVHDLTVTVLDVTGREITKQVRPQTTADQLSFDLSNQAAGIYMVRIMVDQKATYRRVVLTK